MKLRKVEIISICFCALAALLCGMESCAAAYVFIISSSIGLIDNLKNKVASGSIINIIFLLLNIYNAICQ